MKGDWRVIGWRRLSAAAVGRPHWRYRLLAAIWISRAGFQVWDQFTSGGPSTRESLAGVYCEMLKQKPKQLFLKANAVLPKLYRVIRF